MQTAMDMDRDEVGEAEDLMEAYWLQASPPAASAAPRCCRVPGAACQPRLVAGWLAAASWLPRAWC